MAQKLISLEDAAQQLGISKDRLTQLREAGKVRGYRDGATWKLRGEDIDKLAAEGIPSLDSPSSDLALNLDDDLDLSPSEDLPEDPAAVSGFDLELADEEPLDVSMASDISLEDVDEPTVAGIDEGGSDDALALDPDDSIDIYSDSILLSEMELGESAGRPAQHDHR